MPVILLTAFSDDDLVEQATDLPIQGYLVKPVNEGALKATISLAVKRFNETVKLKETGQKLVTALETRKIVDKAKGKLMQEQGLDEKAAYDLMQKVSRDSRQSMRDVAAAIINNPKLG